ncbi:MAG TPA: hypothetical protein VFA74_19430 [Terriglobales bacterium]|nr:hypothetical protein [Terriglobales bacterium]
MARLLLYGRDVPTIFNAVRGFGLLENDMTRAVGWALAKCDFFRTEFVRTLAKVDSGGSAEVVLSLQSHKSESGITDIELELDGQFHMIVEAKRGWELPSRQQLEMYGLRLVPGAFPCKVLVALTDATPEHAAVHLECRSVSGIPVIPFSWGELLKLVQKSQNSRNLKERYIMGELVNYLRDLATLQDIHSNLVWVAPLKDETPQGWHVSWIDIVWKKLRYFHPLSRNFPKVPPNYFAFRYLGKLQSIHHVERYELVPDAHAVIPEIPAGEIIDHMVYTLGSPFRPEHEVKLGNRWGPAHCQCMIDTLFTCKTLEEAVNLTKSREDA